MDGSSQATRPYLELTLDEWLAELSGPAPASGGGASLAYAAASAAAVLVYAAEASQGSWDGAAGAAAQAELLRDRAAPLAQLDAEAYAAALEARRAAAQDPPELRDRAIGAAYARAAEPPLAIARVATDVVLLAGEVATNGEPSVQADATAVAALAAGAALGATGLVAVNLTVTAGDPRVVEADLLAETVAAGLRSIDRRAAPSGG